MNDITKKVNEAVEILNSVFSALPPCGFDEIDEIKNKLKEIEGMSVTVFEDLNKESIEFSQLNRTKNRLMKLSLLVVRCLSLVEFLEHSHAGFYNQQNKDM